MYSYVFTGTAIEEITIRKDMSRDRNNGSEWSCLSGCTTLKHIIFEEGVTLVNAYLCNGVSSLEKITFSSSITQINNYAFCNCKLLRDVQLPENLVVLAEGAFYGCSGIEEISLPSKIEELYSYVFSGTSITEITIPSRTFRVANDGKNESCIYGCTELHKVSYADGSNYVNGYICNGMTGITEIHIPEGVKEIGPCAFYGCTGLKEIEFPASLEIIGKNAFTNCTGLDSIDFPAKLTAIYQEAFYNCSGITEVTLPSKLEELYSYVFTGTGITEIEFPASLVRVRTDGKEESCIYGCNELKKVSFAEGTEMVLAYLCTGASNIKEVILANSITGIDTKAFMGCTGLTEIDLPDSLTWIGNSAFYDCSGITEIILPDGFEQLYSYALTGTGITEIEFPASVFRIRSDGKEDSCIFGCKELQKVSFADGTETVLAFLCNGATNIKEVILPDSITGIDTKAFMGCTGLTNIFLPSSLAWIGNSAFYGCSGITEVQLPTGCEQLFSYAFSGTGITEIEIPASVTRIRSDGKEDSCLYGCKELERVVFENGLGFIPEYVCNGVSSLKEVVIPKTVTGIGKNAFNGCVNLETIYFNGAKRAWQIIEVAEGNSSLTNASTIFNE